MERDYIPISLSSDTTAKLKKLKIAISYSNGRIPSYSEVFDLLLDSLSRVNPGLFSIYSSLPDETRNERL